MKIKYLFAALLISTGFLTSCEKEYPEVETTAIGSAAGTWYVTYKVETSPGVFTDVGGGYSELITYNTAANSATEMWVDDAGHFWEFKVKAALDKGNMSFSGANLSNDYYNSKVTLTEGKIIKDGGESFTKVKVDSIYFKATFSDDTDNDTYIVSGHRRTGFLEDEPH